MRKNSCAAHLIPFRPRSAVVALAFISVCLFAARSKAGIDQLVYDFQQSDFEFGKVESKVPYPPLSWVSYTVYDKTEFSGGPGKLDAGVFQEHDFSQSLILPVYIGKKDLFIAGETFGYSRFDFKEGGRDDEELYTMGLIGGWVQQVSPNSQVSAFASPLITSQLGGQDPEGAEFYTGVVGLYRSSDALTWLYGGVYEYSYGDQFIYPYAGLIWLPTVDWSVSIVAPWPNVTYAVSDRFMLHAGFVPAGSKWSVEANGDRSTLAFGGWNLMAGGEYRLNRFMWLSAGVGVSGFRSFQLSGDGDADMEVKVDRDPIFSMALNFRPPGGLTRRSD